MLSDFAIGLSARIFTSLALLLEFQPILANQLFRLDGNTGTKVAVRASKVPSARSAEGFGAPAYWATIWMRTPCGTNKDELSPPLSLSLPPHRATPARLS